MDNTLCRISKMSSQLAAPSVDNYILRLPIPKMGSVP